MGDRLAPESVVGINRNGWTASSGIGGRNGAEYATNQPINDTPILETMKDRKYWIRLNTAIEHFNLPIDTWNVGNAAY
jgi:hypothetical protein